MRQKYYDSVNFFKVGRLHIMATSARVYNGGFSNSQSKAIVHDLVSLVRQEGLCDKHNLHLNV